MPRNTGPSARCKALLEDEKTPCQEALPRKSWRFCPTHHDQYREATAAYKRASERVEELRKTVGGIRTQLGTLRSTAHVDSAIIVVKGWQSALAEEMRRREVQHKRFFPLDGDVGHRMWIHGLAEDRVQAEDIIMQLRHRREAILDARTRQVARAPATVNTPRSVVPAHVPRVPTMVTSQERTRLLPPPQAHTHHGAYGGGWRVDVERQRAQTHEDTTCGDICSSLVCLIMVVLVVWVLWQVLSGWMTHDV